MIREERQAKALAARAKRKRPSRKQISYDHHYNPLNLICVLHNVKFVKYIFDNFNGSYFTYSHGCPVCVGLIRAKVQLEFKRCSTHGKHRYPKNNSRKLKCHLSNVNVMVTQV